MIDVIKNSEIPYIVKVAQKTNSCDVWYKNETGKTLIVNVSFTFHVPNAVDSAKIRARLDTGAVSVPIGLIAGYAARVNMISVLFVPPGASYQMLRQVTGAATIGINVWTEAY